jgi:hypothetical protein
MEGIRDQFDSLIVEQKYLLQEKTKLKMKMARPGGPGPASELK